MSRYQARHKSTREQPYVDHVTDKVTESAMAWFSVRPNKHARNNSNVYRVRNKSKRQKTGVIGSNYMSYANSMTNQCNIRVMSRRVTSFSNATLAKILFI